MRPDRMSIQHEAAIPLRVFLSHLVQFFRGNHG